MVYKSYETIELNYYHTDVEYLLPVKLHHLILLLSPLNIIPLVQNTNSLTFEDLLKTAFPQKLILNNPE